MLGSLPVSVLALQGAGFGIGVLSLAVVSSASRRLRRRLVLAKENGGNFIAVLSTFLAFAPQQIFAAREGLDNRGHRPGR